jgi:hypothetical protein
MLGGTPVPGPNATLHVLAIYGASGVDVGFNANPTIALASLPSGYDQAYRRIGSIITDASGNIERFFQSGDRFLLKTPFKSASTRAQSVATTGTLITLYVPSGIKTQPLIRGLISGNPEFVSFYDPDQAFTAFTMSDLPTASTFLHSTQSNPNFYDVGQNNEMLLTNTNRQLGVISTTVITSVFNWDVWGWVDQRNRLQP